jgi:hypothetical protein
MKTTMLTVLLAALLLAPVLGHATDKFVEAMQKNIKAVYEAKDISGLQDAVNSLERISAVEKSRWEPLYYIGFGNIMMANREPDLGKRDAYLDRAEEAVRRALELAPQESEIVALEGFVHMIRISVDPQSRGMAYAPRAMESFNKAIALNGDNPRAHALLAQMMFGTAQFFGSPTTEACASNSLAAEKLKSFKSDNPIAPVWGERMIVSLVEKCK